MQFRTVLGGAYNSRISAVNAADTTSGYVGTGIVGLMIVGKATSGTEKDVRMLNCFNTTVSDPILGKKEVYTVKRPGWGTQSTPATGEKGYAVLVWTGQGTGQKIISAFGETNSTIYDADTSLGAITGKCTGLTETILSGTANLAVTSSDSTAWYYTVAAGAMTKITDVDFPGNASKTLAGTFAHMDGFAFVMDTTGALWASDLNSLTGWTANNFDSANAYPDKGIGCIRYKNFIMAFGTESVQFFYNAGLTPFPFAKAVAMTQKVGAVSADAITSIADTIFWAGSTPQGGLSIFQYDGGISRVSTPEIDALIILAGASNISMTTIRNYGRSFVYVTAGSTTYAYCIEEKDWMEISTTTPLTYKCAGVSVGGTMVNYAVSNVSTSGKVFLQNHASLVFTDNGVAYTARAQGRLDNHGTKKTKFFSEIEVVCDREITASTATILYTDDDYINYTTAGTVDLSEARPRLTRLGSSKERAWVLVHAAATPMRVRYLEGQVEVGTH